MIEFPGVYGGTVRFTMDPTFRKIPDSVLILVSSDHGILFTQHEVRGWELPGGKIERGETAMAAAVREAYEETGVELDQIAWVAQYEAIGGSPDYLCKWVYSAKAYKQNKRPHGFETIGSKWINPWPSPQSILADTSYSPLVRDRVYQELYMRFALQDEVKSSSK